MICHNILMDHLDQIRSTNSVFLLVEVIDLLKNCNLLIEQQGTFHVFSDLWYIVRVVNLIV